MKYLSTLLIFLFGLLLSLNAQDLYWLQQEGGTSDDTPRAVVVDDDNNVWVGIEFEGTIDVGTTSFTAINETDFIIVKYDSAGNYLGAKQFGGTLQNRIRDLAVYNGNIIGIGYAHNFQNVDGVNYAGLGGEDLFIFKMNSNFVVLDLFMAGSNLSDQGYAVDVDSDGNIYFSGYFRGPGNVLGTTVAHFGNTDAVFGKIDWNGNLVWVQNAGSSSYDAAFSIDLVNDTMLVVGGEYIGTLNFNGQTITSPVPGNDQSWIVKMDTSGSYQWHYIATDAGYNSVQKLASDDNGNIYAAGYIQTFTTTFGNGDTSLIALGDRDAYLLKLDTDGNFDWIRQGQSNGWFFPGGLTVFDDNIYLTGYYTDEGYITDVDTLFHSGDNDFYLLNVNTNGDLDWYIAGGGSSNDAGMSVATDKEGRIAVVSAISNGFQVSGSPVFGSAGGRDALVTFLSPCEFPETLLNITGEDTVCQGASLLYEIVNPDTTATYFSLANLVFTDTASWDGSSVTLEVPSDALSLDTNGNTIAFRVLGEGCLESDWVNAGFVAYQLTAPSVSFDLSQNNGVMTAINTATDDYGIAGFGWSVDGIGLMSSADTLNYTLTPGQHDICLEVFNIHNCVAETCEMIDISTGINEVYRENLHLKFNPSEKLLFWTTAFNLDYQIFDLNGQLLLQGKQGNQVDLNFVNNQIVIYRLFNEKEEFASGKIWLK